MQINVTFLIQVANFCISYYFLDIILLRPMVKSLQKKEALKDRLIKGVGEKERELHSLQYQKEIDLQNFQIRLEKNYVLPEFVLQEVPLYIHYQRDVALLDKLILQGSELLVKEVVHAHRH